MQIVIDISEAEYKLCKRHVADGIINPLKIYIANGTPLPKGHGRLIDADEIAGDGSWDFSDRLDETPTIIKADKAESEVEE